MLAGMTLPTTEEIERKVKEIQQALSYRMNESDIDTVRCLQICSYFWQYSKRCHFPGFIPVFRLGAFLGFSNLYAAYMVLYVQK